MPALPEEGVQLSCLSIQWGQGTGGCIVLTCGAGCGGGQPGVPIWDQRHRISHDPGIFWCVLIVDCLSSLSGFDMAGCHAVQGSIEGEVASGWVSTYFFQGKWETKDFL